MRKNESKEKREEMTQEIYTGSSHKPRVVQSPCTSKGFHYNHQDYKCSSSQQETSNAQVTPYKRLPNAQAHWRETSNNKNKYNVFEQ